MTVEGFATAEEAVLAGWQTAPGARAQVRSATFRGERAEVIIETEQGDGDHLDYVYCVQGDAGRWREVVSGNGPTVRWDDPDEYDPLGIGTSVALAVSQVGGS